IAVRRKRVLKMNSDEFRKYGKVMVDYVADFWNHIRDRRPLPDVKPGYIKEVVPNHAPSEPEDWSTIFNDLEEVIMKGNTYWHHPHFFAYFPTACSYPAIMADILSGGIAGIGFSWNSGPAMTELEMATLDWLVDVLALPEHFKCTASDATFIAIISARAKAVEEIKNGLWMVNNDLDKTLEAEQVDADILYPHFHDPAVFQRFVAYCSDQAHSSVDKGAILSGVRLRKLKSSIDPKLKNYTVTKQTLEAAITVRFLHAPNSVIMSKGVELVDSFNFNPHKAMLVNFDCSPMWFKDGVTVTKYFNVDATYLKHEHQAVAADYRHLQVALGRRFRALKIWFVLRKLGVGYIQNLLRKQNHQAMLFASLITESNDFELFVPQHLGLVCFRIKDSTNEENEALCGAINDDRRIHLVPSKNNLASDYCLILVYTQHLAIPSNFLHDD
ncbi:hypothetical protein KIN20_035021, partial [Parelaphostrongylus tenuis]